MHELTGHIELKSIFSLSSEDQKGLCWCAFASSPVEEPFCDCCPTQSPAPFTYLNEFLPSSKTLQTDYCALYSTSHWDLLCEHQTNRSESDCVCVKEFLWSPVEILGRSCPFQVRKQANYIFPVYFIDSCCYFIPKWMPASLFNGNYKQPSFVWLLSMSDTWLNFK